MRLAILKTYIGNADKGRKDQRGNPMHMRRSEGRPRKAEETDGFQRCEPEQPFESFLGL